jgi:alcohol dehydrogenase (NADP+)
MDLAIVGCGTIAAEYATAIAEHEALELSATTDLDIERAEALAAEHDATAYEELEMLLEQTSASTVVNLTSHAAHAPVTRECLEAGLHVYSEKPLALDTSTARELVDLAADRERYLACAPFALDGDAQQLTWQLLEDGRLGTVRVGYANCHIGRLTEWHDDPQSFLEVGPLFDGAVYPLSVLTAYFGPVEAVETAHSSQLLREHEHDGERFTVDTPDQTVAMLRFATGTWIQLTASAYVPYQTKHFNSIEFHGDDGSLFLRNCGDTDAPEATPSVEYARLGTDYLPVRRQSEPNPLDRAHPLVALESSLRSGGALPPSLDPVRAAHTVAVIEAIQEAAETGDSVSVSAFQFECPMPPNGDTITSVPAARDDSMLPPIGIGCSRYRDGTYVERIDSIEDALDAGYRLLDMAELYGNERAIGDLLDESGSPDRETLFLLSKVWNTNHRPQHVREACEQTLDRLGTDQLDCYMVHWPTAWKHQGQLGELKERPVEEAEALTFPTDEDGEPLEAGVSLAETWRAMERLVEDGLTTHLGISNVDREQLGDLLETAEVPPQIVQVESHPYQPRTALVEFCQDRGIEVMAAAPLSADGLLSEPVLEEIAAEHGVSTAQVVLRWNIERDVVPIPSSTDREHVLENVDCFRFELSEDECRRVDELCDPDFERA